MHRNNEKNQITKISNSKKSHFLYLRGRRRVGKSWLLVEISKKNKNFFYFMGGKDARDENNQELFVEKWEAFSGQKNLSLLKKSALSWNKIFQDITLYTSKHNLTLALDEIQWIAKTGSGFCGLLKEHWLQWEKTNNIKIIICGSSNRFFHDNSGGEEQLLRGLKTHSDIWIQPFSISEIQKYKFKSWNQQEVVLLYMLLGGVAYYIQQIDEKKGFIHAINTGLFLKSSVFLEEVEELLRIEFNKTSVQTVKTILRELGPNGNQQQPIVKKTFLAKSTVSETVEKLIDYSLVFIKKESVPKKLKNQAGITYIMKDFFIHAYYQVLEPLADKIKTNDSSLIFPVDVLKEKKGYFINNFTGPAFERILVNALESGIKKYPKIYSKLNLVDQNFEILSHTTTETQIDVIVRHKKDRVCRVIEVKWINKKNVTMKSLCEEVLSKKYYPDDDFTRMNYLFVSFKPSAAELKLAKNLDVTILTIADLF